MKNKSYLVIKICKFSSDSKLKADRLLANFISLDRGPEISFTKWTGNYEVLTAGLSRNPVSSATKAFLELQS